MPALRTSFHSASIPRLCTKRQALSLAPLALKKIHRVNRYCIAVRCVVLVIIVHVYSLKIAELTSYTTGLTQKIFTVKIPLNMSETNKTIFWAVIRNRTNRESYIELVDLGQGKWSAVLGDEEFTFISPTDDLWTVLATALDRRGL